ncbi:MAG: DNA mismatch repair endonuclease MutH [Gammaproteobacteria bacterium]
MSTPRTAPASEAELVARADALAGLTLGEIAARHGVRLPPDLRRHKGIIGELLEAALGASAGSRPEPDFVHLGIELKTIPVDRRGRPRESTHVCTVALTDLVGQSWTGSTVLRKLSRVLWVPVESAAGLAPADRRVGRPRLWSPSPAEAATLRSDWEEHMELIATGRLAELDARLGVALQVRPKAPNRDALGAASDADGAPAATLPRGFYLRPQFTARILAGAL